MSRTKAVMLTGLAVIAATAGAGWVKGTHPLGQAGPPLLAGVAAVAPATALAQTAPATALTQPVPGDGRTLGFAATYLYHDVYDKNPSMCPGGMNQSHMELYLPTVDDAERQRLSHPDNARELFYGKSSMNLAGQPMCLAPDSPVAPALKPEFKVVAGTGPAHGMDLDGQVSRQGGKAAANTCGHDDFVGLNGERGVDNQFYRVVGCTKGFRNDSLAAQMVVSSLKSGAWDLLIELGDVDDRQNDPEITVSYYSAQDPGPFAGGVTPVPWRSMSIVDDQRYIATGKGRIENGIVTSSPIDLRYFNQAQRPGEKANGSYGGATYIRGARINAKLDKDGLAGMIGGYLDIANFSENNIRRHGHVAFATGAAATGAYSCPSLKAAIDRYADGYRDAQTGKCTAISTSFTLKAIPVFVIKPGDRRTAPGD